MAHPPLSHSLPPLLLGSATFNSQYNKNPFSLPTNPIIHRFLTSSGPFTPGFDTSPYYGPAEILLGRTLKHLAATHNIQRPSYFLATKIGRIAAAEFDYSPSWIRQSITRSLDRLGTAYLDLVYCHDVEFVSLEEVLIAITTLRELRSEGKIRYVGISGYPVAVLAELAKKVYDETGEALDAVMSYSNYTIQNTRLHSQALQRLKDAKVDCVLNASLLGMGLLRSQGVPVGDMGDFHPSSDDLRWVCSGVAAYAGKKGKKLEDVAYRWALENWADVGSSVGAGVAKGGRIGVSVIGVSYLEELESILNLWRDVIKARDGDVDAKRRRKENDALVEELKGVFGQWYDDVWESPGEGYIRKQPGPDRLLSDVEVWPELKAAD
ncbi:hypothetical protein H072_2468 [Dactylellina haptotyla CBS 200.50]|uniref:NADP-dependent oxidoreductase domain-containing protein n=1 Tax=Dactylellina haptotyla (strain CBS 200.50) TaxID=1284197 RepID=S8AR45_DACHA|nr:hypothetical protein H072_2468 [Dactylellina haptotyla CBS 200.50]